MLPLGEELLVTSHISSGVCFALTELLSRSSCVTSFGACFNYCRQEHAVLRVRTRISASTQRGQIPWCNFGQGGFQSDLEWIWDRHRWRLQWAPARSLPPALGALLGREERGQHSWRLRQQDLRCKLAPVLFLMVWLFGCAFPLRAFQLPLVLVLHLPCVPPEAKRTAENIPPCLFCASNNIQDLRVLWVTKIVSGGKKCYLCCSLLYFLLESFQLIFCA